MTYTPEQQKEFKKLKNIYYIIAYALGYVFPLVYFIIKLGVTKEVTATKIVVPILIISFVGISKLASDIPKWVSTWEPSFKKGIIKAIPKFLLFTLLVTMGLTLKYMLHNAIDLAFNSYFETVFVIFGGLCLGAIFEALHLKYKELYLMSKGYVLGTING